MEINIQNVIICVLIIGLIYCLYMHYCSEQFVSLEEKSSQLTKWMNKNPRGRYVKFIQDNPESNIVEYTKLRDLSARTGGVNTKSASELLRMR